MPQLFTELHVQEPPEGKYEPAEVGGKPRVTLESTTDDPALTTAALDKDNNARTLSPHNQPEVSVDGSTTTAVIEPPDSERNRFEELQRRTEEAEVESMRDFQPLTEADKVAKQEALERPNVERYNTALEQFKAEHPDFDDVVAQAADVDFSETKRQALMQAGPQAVYGLMKDPEAAQRFAAMSDDQAADFLQGNADTQAEAPQKRVYDAILEEVANEGADPTVVAERMAASIFSGPDPNETAAKYQYLDLCLSQVGNRNDVVKALAKDTQLLGKLATVETPDQMAKMIHTLSAKLKFPEAAQKARPQPVRNKLRPMKPVSGSIRIEPRMDEMSYQDYKAARAKQIRARREAMNGR